MKTKPRPDYLPAERETLVIDPDSAAYWAARNKAHDAADYEQRMLDAAPDLLAALIECLEQIDGAHDERCSAINAPVPCNCFLSRASAAIERAKGAK